MWLSPHLQITPHSKKYIFSLISYHFLRRNRILKSAILYLVSDFALISFTLSLDCWDIFYTSTYVQILLNLSQSHVVFLVYDWAIDVQLRAIGRHALWQKIYFISLYTLLFFSVKSFFEITENLPVIYYLKSYVKLGG